MMLPVLPQFAVRRFRHASGRCASMKLKLTKKAVEAAEVPASEKQDLWLWDSEVPGFGCRVTNTGTRVYVLQTRVKGRTRKFRIGRHGAITTELGREAAKRMLADILRGEDPATERLAQRSS